MTKTEFVEQLAKGQDMPKSDAEKILHAFLDAVEDALSRDGNLKLPGFGAFKVLERKAYETRNALTNENIVVAAKKIIRFHPASALKSLANGLADKPDKID